ncbi:acetyl-CoA synthetase-like protein [Epithele typhae]|uniref:acetyl-CoA synthetase-like protein n=1 Tax=Epithele typhae TaxID=378194 RepID=UPI0020082FEF|nr:acetyl-CoA synthetase-like protein [Epithele typhae]KAH9915952.1 acetyl-CoA synthetase-like protein [Epithele typhae]
MPQEITNAPPIITPQGAQCTTWTPIPFYSKLAIPELFAFHYEHSPDHPVFGYLDEADNYVEIKHKDVYPAIRRAAKFAVDNVPFTATREQRPIIAILAHSDTITYATLVLGVILAGFTPFAVSARNSPAAVAHLARQTGARVLFVSPDQECSASRQRPHDHAVELRLMPTFERLYGTEAQKHGQIDMAPFDMEDTAIIIHSSGSTAFPKPIRISQKLMAFWAQSMWYQQYDFCGIRFSTQSLPMFHVMGWMNLSWMLGAGFTTVMFRPTSPPIMPTPDGVMNTLVKTKCRGLAVVPAFIEAWSRDPKTLPTLQELDFVIYGGAPLNKDVGHELVHKNVKIISGYGMTEIGSVAQSYRTSQYPDAAPGSANPDWQYLAVLEPIKYHRAYVDDTPGVFELVIVESDTWGASVYNTTVDGKRAFKTNDLFEEHPSDPRAFRSSDARTSRSCCLQEKRSALFISALHQRDHHPTCPWARLDPADDSALEAFRASVWDTVERANKHAPAHSRLFKELVIVTHPDKPFQLSSKRLPRRQICIDDYAAEIEEAYRRVAESSQADIELPKDWTTSGARLWLSDVVAKVLGHAVGNDDDLFQQGLDRCPAGTWIRNTVTHALHTSTPSAAHAVVPANLVYAHPTITALAEVVSTLAAGEDGVRDPAGERAARTGKMGELLTKYSAKWPPAQWTPLEGAPLGGELEVALVTGTTGRLGEVRKIYALNRGAADKARGRQTDAFKTWGLDSALLESAMVQGRIVFYEADLTRGDLGLGAEVLQEVKDSVTSVIHNAWRVDFNVSLPSFEPLIAGARHLLDVALGSSVPGGPKVIFISSISALINQAIGTPAQESLTYGPEIAVGLGYGESKWVTEQLLGRAATETGLRTIVARVGQLSGDRAVGGWGTKEWVPAIARLSQLVGCAPMKEDTVAWLPIDVAAASVLEFLTAPHPERTTPVYHVTAPYPVMWADVLTPMAARLGVPLVPSAEWVEKVKVDASAPGRKHESAHELVGFFEVTMAGRETLFATERAEAAARTLREMTPLGEADVERWLRYWAGVGFLEV